MNKGDLEFTDNHHLAKLIQYGNDNDKEIASEEWVHRFRKPYPYHPSYENERYPE